MARYFAALFALALALAATPLVACDDADSGVCTSPNVLLYFTAGCDAAPTCAAPVQDACVGTACSCEGKTTIIGCGFSSGPFASFGPCPGQDEDGVTLEETDAGP